MGAARMRPPTADWRWWLLAISGCPAMHEMGRDGNAASPISFGGFRAHHRPCSITGREDRRSRDIQTWDVQPVDPPAAAHANDSRPTRCVLQLATSGIRELKHERGWVGRLVCSIPSIRDATGWEAPTAAHSASSGSQGGRQPGTDERAHLSDLAQDCVLIGAGWTLRWYLPKISSEVVEMRAPAPSGGRPWVGRLAFAHTHRSSALVMTA